MNKKGFLNKEFLGHTKAVNSLSLHGDFVVSGSDDGNLIIYKSFDFIKTIQLHKGFIQKVVSNGTYLASASLDGAVHVFDASMNLINTIAIKSAISNICWTADTTLLVCRTNGKFSWYNVLKEQVLR